MPCFSYTETMVEGVQELRRQEKGIFQRLNCVPLCRVCRKHDASPVEAFERGDKPKEGQGVKYYNVYTVFICRSVWTGFACLFQVKLTLI